MFYIVVVFFMSLWYIPYNNTEIDPILIPYYNEYISIVKEYCKEDQNGHEQYHNDNFKLKFGKLDYNEIAVCQGFPNAFKITVDKRQWGFLDDEDKFSTVVHEFSHCMFEISHFDNPNHYMYYANTHVPKSLVVKQFKEILKYKCTKN